MFKMDEGMNPVRFHLIIDILIIFQTSAMIMRYYPAMPSTASSKTVKGGAAYEIILLSIYIYA
jgi:hypothetical protein